MYLPSRFAVTDLDRILTVARENPFATLITQTPDGPMVSHVPMIVRDDGVISGHVARANPHWKLLDGDRDSLVIFHGPHAYVSPRWYEGRENVPTWSYVVVHAAGRPRLVTDTQRVLGELRRMVETFEGPEGWRMEAAGKEFVENLSRGMVAFEIEAPRWEGKFKVGQNRNPEDAAGALRELQAAGDEQSAGVARWMRELGVAGSSVKQG